MLVRLTPTLSIACTHYTYTRTHTHAQSHEHTDYILPFLFYCIRIFLILCFLSLITFSFFLFLTQNVPKVLALHIQQILEREEKDFSSGFGIAKTLLDRFTFVTPCEIVFPDATISNTLIKLPRPVKYSNT